MSIGRVVDVYKTRLGCAMSATVVGDNAVTLLPVDSNVVDFDEEGGQLQHQPTGDIYTYASADIDAETITLAAGLPSGKTLTAGDGLYVYPRADDYYADVAVDDVATDVVSARVPEMLRTILEEGTKEHRKGPLVRLLAGAEEWHITEKVGETPVISTGNFETGDIKMCGWDVPGGGVLIDGGWLKADHSAVSRATYAALFNRYGTTYGAGDGSTTFNLPDVRGRAVFGTGTIIALGATDGKAEATRGPGHVHGITDHTGHQHTIPSVSHAGASTTPITGGADRVTSIAGTLGGSHDHTGNVGSGGAHAHGGETQGGLTSSDPFSYIGFHFLVKT